MNFDLNNPEKNMNQTWKLSGGYKREMQPNIEAGWARLRSKIHAEKAPAKIVPFQNRPILRIAAAVALLIGAFLIYKNISGDHPNLVQTANGERQKVELQDGSFVWLNENSSLSFPSEFSSKSRLVKLNGEAVFEVAKSQSQPFVVETENAQVRVLGTVFNVETSEQETEVQVREGKVSLKPLSSEKEILLAKGDKGSFNTATTTLKLERGKAFNPGAWQQNGLKFSNAPLALVVEDVADFYNIQLEITDQTLKSCLFTTNFENEQLEVVLKTLERGFNCKIKPTGNRSYQLSGGKCQ